MKLKYKLGLVIIGVMIIMCFMTFQSYALFVANLSGNENSLDVGCFKIEFTESSSSIALSNTYPMNDTKGLTITPYTFTITNKCTNDASYSVILSSLTTNGIDDSNIKYAIYETTKPSTGTLLTSATTYTDTYNLANVKNRKNSYQVATGGLKGATEENGTGGSKTYNLILWLDEATGNDAMSKTFSASVNVVSAGGEYVETAVEKITELAQTDTTNFATDDYSNVRYIGKNPNNYVWVDNNVYQYDTYSLMYDGEYYGMAENTTLEECQSVKTSAELDNDTSAECKKEHTKGDKILWRIMGVMKNIDDGTGNKSDRVKLIRADSIGFYSWDTSESSINSGYGVNEWSQADLMKLLNPGYESESVGGSLYWNNKQGTCYNNENNGITSCNFTSTGIKEKLKNMIGNAVWNTGSNGTNDWTSASGGFTKHFYAYERSDNTGKICSSGFWCNDTVERTTTWKGLVGLMYPSDYGYATSGGSTTDRATCLNKELYNWSDSSVSDCKNNDWLFNSSYQWTLSPSANSSRALNAFFVFSGGSVYDHPASTHIAARPVVYLTSNVKISGGEGTSKSPYQLEL